MIKRIGWVVAIQNDLSTLVLDTLVLISVPVQPRPVMWAADPRIFQRGASGTADRFRAPWFGDNGGGRFDLHCFAETECLSRRLSCQLARRPRGLKDNEPSGGYWLVRGVCRPVRV